MGKYLNMLRRAEESQQRTSRGEGPVQRQSFIASGNQITWRGADGKPHGPATVDFVHTSDDGSRWVFCTLPEGQTAVNTKFMTEIEGDTHGR